MSFQRLLSALLVSSLLWRGVQQPQCSPKCCIELSCINFPRSSSVRSTVASVSARLGRAEPKLWNALPPRILNTLTSLFIFMLKAHLSARRRTAAVCSVLSLDIFQLYLVCFDCLLFFFCSFWPHFLRLKNNSIYLTIIMKSREKVTYRSRFKFVFFKAY